MTRLRETFNAPLPWFLLAGFGLFILDSKSDDHAAWPIEVSAGDIQRLQDQLRAQTGGHASTARLDERIDELILERRLAREARALGLDQEDVIIQRRLAQKLKFLTEDLSDDVFPDERALRSYFENHRGDYREAEKFSFRHVFFSVEKRGQEAESDALNVLAMLQYSAVANWRSLGDPSIVGRSFENQSFNALAQSFGPEFVEQLSLWQGSGWQGPLRSELGLHLLIVDDYLSAPQSKWTDVRERVLYDYRRAQRALSFARYVETLERKYPAVVAVNRNAEIEASAGAAK
jgi:hypothetical protein